MDSAITFGTMASVLKAYGPFGLLVVIWFFDIRFMRRLIDRYREDTSKIMQQHKEYMEELRTMYENNVKLVEGYEDVANDLKEVVIMNTRAMTKVCDDIEQNQFCPMQRVNKERIQVAKS